MDAGIRNRFCDFKRYYEMKIHDCYCYNEKCNQQEWEKQGKTGKRRYTVMHGVTQKD